MTRQTKRMKFSGCKKFPIISSTTQKKSNLENSFNIQYAIKYSYTIFTISFDKRK